MSFEIGELVYYNDIEKPLDDYEETKEYAIVVNIDKKSKNIMLLYEDGIIGWCPLKLVDKCEDISLEKPFMMKEYFLKHIELLKGSKDGNK